MDNMGLHPVNLLLQASFHAANLLLQVSLHAVNLFFQASLHAVNLFLHVRLHAVNIVLHARKARVHQVHHLLEAINRLLLYEANVFRVLRDLIANYCPVLFDSDEPLILLGELLLVLRDLLCICHDYLLVRWWGELRMSRQVYSNNAQKARSNFACFTRVNDKYRDRFPTPLIFVAMLGVSCRWQGPCG